MYSAFNNLSDRKKKHADLLKQIKLDQEIEEMKQEAFKNAMWASDVKENKISLKSNTTTLGTQTDAPKTSTSSLAANSFARSPAKLAFSLPPTAPAASSAPPTTSTGTSMDIPIRSEGEMMQDEDKLSDLMRHR